MLKTYFTAATSYDGELDNLYDKIFSILENEGLTMISGKQIVDKTLLKKDRLLTSKEIYKRENKLIDKTDFVVAEVSRPSLGVGSEIVYALSKHKPVLTLVSEGYENKISPIIAGNPSDNLFLEIYTENRLLYIIKDFIAHVKTLKKRLGKLIVIDGGDGSGKTTQANLLVEFLKSKKISVKYMDFPQYYHSFHGKTVAKFLRGEFGKIDEVSPYLASLAYALDRASVKKEMEDFLESGGYIISNRYATSSMAHQSAKFTDEKEKKEFLKWIYELEYKVHKIPKENLVIFLYVPWQIGLTLTENRPAKNYLNGANADIHEKDLKYRQAVEKTYLELAKKNKHWVKIDCMENDKLLSKKTIRQKILSAINERLNTTY